MERGLSPSPRCGKVEVRIVGLLISSRDAAVPAVPLTLENPHVGSAESRVAQRVAHRVHSTIDVAKIIKKIPQLLGYVPRAGGDGLEEYQDVIWGPRDDEGKQNGRQRFRSLPISLLLLQLLLLLVRLLVRYGLARRQCLRYVLRV